MNRTATVTVSISSDPRFATRYFVDFRDTTGGRNRQLRTWHMDAPEARELLAGLREQAGKAGVALEATDQTREDVFA